MSKKISSTVLLLTFWISAAIMNLIPLSGSYNVAKCNPKFRTNAVLVVHQQDKTSGSWKTGDHKVVSCEMCYPCRKRTVWHMWPVLNLGLFVIPAGGKAWGEQGFIRIAETKKISAASPALQSTPRCENTAHCLRWLSHFRCCSHLTETKGAVLQVKVF